MNEIRECERILLDALLLRYPELAEIRESIMDACLLMRSTYLAGGKMLVAGNGGSAADAEHIVGELMKGFVRKRPLDAALKEALIATDAESGIRLAEQLQGALPAIALSNHAALSTAFLNDVDGRLIYAQQGLGYGREGDVFLGISTSGNAKNIYHAAVTAKAKRMKVVGLTGLGGGHLKEIADVTVAVHVRETYLVQERHLPIYHCWCLMLEAFFFDDGE